MYLPGTVSGQKNAAEKIFRLHTYRPCGYPYGYPQLADPVFARLFERVAPLATINVALARHWW